MISRIYLTNFRRIESADIEVRDGITCLTGLNGSGKSSIIEAMEFCLYGKTKSGTNKETIRRHGATDDEPTYTSIDFEMGDRHYRCRRYLTRKGSTVATLHAYDDESYARLREANDDETDLDKGQKSLSGLGTQVASGAKGVTDAITELFGMSYAEFTASFVARQKELDSLSGSQRPEERKKFFLDLLNYSQLEDVKKEFNKETRTLKSSLEALEKQMILPEDVQGQIEQLAKSLRELARRTEKGTAMVGDQEAKVAALDERITSMMVTASKLDAAEARLRESKDGLARERESLARLEDEAKRLEEQSRGYDPQTGVAGQLGNVRREIDKATAYATQRRERDQIAGIIAQRQDGLARETQDIARLEEKTKDEPKVDAANEALAEAKSSLGQLNGRKNMLDGEVAKIGGLIKSVEAGEAAVCPTCGTDIASESGRGHLNGEMERLAGEVSSLTSRIEDAQQVVRAREQSVTRMRNLLTTYQRNMRDLERKRVSVASLSADLEERKQTLAAKDEYLKEHADDARTDIQLSELETKRADLERKQAREEAMRKAYLDLQKTRERTEASKQRIAELADAEKVAQRFVDENAPIRQSLEKAKAQRDEENTKLNQYRGHLYKLQQEQGRDDEAMRNLRDELVKAKRQAKDRSKLRSQYETYVGGRDVVAFLREYLPSKIAPTLSARASRLLDVATNGMYSMLEIDDAYEVSVYTDDDIRPIAMMSGGEQDIIALCIRIAIAELILSATGIQRQTLVLDEIFGALDDERRASSCRALQSLGSMIPRIICITHIEDIKDMADYTYVVERDEHGVSHVREIVDATMGPVTQQERAAIAEAL